MKKCALIGYCMLLLAFLLCPMTAGAEETEPQFPFYAQTNELVVYLRQEMAAESQSVGSLERGQELMVLSASINEAGEVWYEVMLAEGGTSGYIRSDLLIPSDQIQAEIAAHRAAYGEAQGEYIGNRRTKKFHRTTCHTLPKESNRVYFDTRENAVEEGFDPCGNCHP